jgi:hypothetical protein
MKRLFERLRAWLAWARAKVAPSRINRPAPIPAAPAPLSVLKRRPAIYSIAGRDYFRDNAGTYWRVMGHQRNAAGALVYVVGRRVAYIADAASGRVTRVAP